MTTAPAGPGGLLALPKAGGAVRGIGETFSPDLHTGTANFTVPLAVPAGRSGLQPRLELVYSSGHGNGPFGLGWSLSIPEVSRKTSSGVPVYDDLRDTFVLSGNEDLVPVDAGVGSTRYRPRVDTSFARIVHRRDSNDDVWTVESRDGLVSRYGDDGAVISDPDTPGRIFSWAVSLTTDPFGNRIEYAYDAGRNSALTLREVRYADFGPRAAPRFAAGVRFIYDDRPDRFSSHRSGFEVRHGRRCRLIEMFTDTDQVRVGRRYRLTYLDQLVGEDELPPNRVSLLARIECEGVDGTQTQPLPSLDFGYRPYDLARRRFDILDDRDLPAVSLARPEYELVDLFGEGLPSVVTIGAGPASFWRNRGGGRFDAQREMRAAPVGVSLADPGVDFLDADGDGRLDLMVSGNGHSGYFPLGVDGEFADTSFRSYAVSPPFLATDPDTRLVDLDGDGVTDALHTGTSFECFFQDRDGWASTRVLARGPLEDFPDVQLSDPRVHLADVSGDGLADIVLVQDGRIDYWPSLGHGRFGPRVTMGSSPRLPIAHDPRRVLFGDLDGDGFADVVFVGDGHVTCWINRGGQAWDDPVQIVGTPVVTDADGLRFVDLFGTGVAGLLWTAERHDGSATRLAFLDPVGRRKPYLLDRVRNGMGAVTRIEYAASTEDYLADEERPETRWRTRLPFPVQVVKRVQVEDLLTGSTGTTTYRYHHGHWDGREREFRGFGRVDSYDAEVAGVGAGTAPPILTRTWFHQGPHELERGRWHQPDASGEYWPGDPSVLQEPSDSARLRSDLPLDARRDACRSLRGRVIRTETYALDGSPAAERPIAVTEHAYGVRLGATELGGERRVVFPHAVATRTTQWQRGNDPHTVLELTGGYDPYGLPSVSTAVALPRGVGPVAALAPTALPRLITRSVTRRAQRDDAVYLVDRIASSTDLEVVDDGSLPLASLLLGVDAGTVAQRVLAHTVNRYDGAAFEGLPPGELGAHGALNRVERLVLTEDILAAAYGGERPPYLVPGPTVWTAEYPQEFRDLLPDNAGYVFHPGDATWRVEGFYALSQRCRRDVHDDPDGRGLQTVGRDPRGNDIASTYDQFALFPVRLEDAGGLVTTADYDYRVPGVRLTVDPNGARTEFTYTPLGLVASVARSGPDGEGETLSAPGERYDYDLTGRPASVRAIRRSHHPDENDVPLPQRDETTTTVTFSDGFGRILQTRTQAEDVRFGDATFGDAGLPADPSAVVGPADGRVDVDPVVVSGWQVYDVKGRVVARYEPFFSTGFDYAPPVDTELGRRVDLQYDALGALHRTVGADGSHHVVVHGVPALDDPEHFAPTPWETYTYDVNDNAGRTHPAASAPYSDHWNTPSSAVVDGRGRIVELVERTGPTAATTTRTSYDARGNPVEVFDGLGRRAFCTVFDLLGRPVAVTPLDGGARRTVLDAAGSPIERRDARRSLALDGFDYLGRRVRGWARDELGEPVTLRERVVYGDSPDSGLTRSDAVARRALGRLVRHYDEAGLLALEGYDFNGNPLERVRRVLADAVLAAPSFRMDWEPPPGTSTDAHAETLLDTQAYRTSLRYDALARPKRLQHPEDPTGGRRELRVRHNRAGGLEGVEVDGTSVIEHVSYTAAGQPALMVYGNGVMTRWAYDRDTSRMVRCRSERFASPALHRYEPSGAPLADTVHGLDLAGNLLRLEERRPGAGVPGTPDRLDRQFVYDPTYRLRSATGRECDVPAVPVPWDPTPRCQDLTRTRAYTEEYDFDDAGNLLRLRHVGNGATFVRQFDLEPGTDRVREMTAGGLTFGYQHDANGNLVRETTSRRFEWDHRDRLRTFEEGPPGHAPTVRAQYLYGGDGRRVVRYLTKQAGQVEVTLDLGDGYEVRRVVTAGSTVANATVLVSDGRRPVVTLRSGPALPGETVPAVLYQLADHLGSVTLSLDATGAEVDREEFAPFGETTFGSVGQKRYRFGSKARDPASGLYDYGARYYHPATARFLSPDPKLLGGGGATGGPAARLNLYGFVLGNPLKYVDPSGLDPELSGTYNNTGSPGVESTTASFDAADPDNREATFSTNRSFRLFGLKWSGITARAARIGTSASDGAVGLHLDPSVATTFGLPTSFNPFSPSVPVDLNLEGHAQLSGSLADVLQGRVTRAHVSAIGAATAVHPFGLPLRYSTPVTGEADAILSPGGLAFRASYTAGRSGWLNQETRKYEGRADLDLGERTLTNWRLTRRTTVTSGFSFYKRIANPSGLANALTLGGHSVPVPFLLDRPVGDPEDATPALYSEFFGYGYSYESTVTNRSRLEFSAAAGAGLTEENKPQLGVFGVRFGYSWW